MAIVHRILPSTPIVRLEDHLAGGGGVGLAAALQMTPDDVVELVSASGLRGRGGAGFPTGVKWAAVREHRGESASTVVVNGVEGEPGTFKDRSILRSNPFGVLEGALIAAHAVGADRVIVGLKESFRQEIDIVNAAVAELVAARWCDSVEIVVFEGTGGYLLGEETALLETIDGRPPFPRIAPPYRRGVDEVVESEVDVRSGSGLAAHVEMADTSGTSEAPPTLVDNVETMANVTFILASGVDEFRSLGTAESPGTIVCTVTGAVRTPGVAEVELGTPLAELIDVVAGGPLDERRVVAVLPGVSNAVIGADDFGVALTYEDMAAIGSGLGSGGYVVYDDADDLVEVAAGVSRFLYVESCGQCTPCKQDGGAISAGLDRLLDAELDPVTRAAALEEVRGRLGTVADGARCALARQHEAVVGSLLEMFEAEVADHVEAAESESGRALVGELVDLHDGITLVDEHILVRQPDWSDDEIDSGETPVERLADHRASVS